MVTPFHSQDMEKHGRLICCVSELRQMLLTPIKPYTAVRQDPVLQEPAQEQWRDKTQVRLRHLRGRGRGQLVWTVRKPRPNSSPNNQHSSSDRESDLEELLAKDFPHEDLPSLLTRAMGKGRVLVLLVVCACCGQPHRKWSPLYLQSVVSSVKMNPAMSHNRNSDRC